MASKSTEKEIKKYSGVADKVKETASKGKPQVEAKEQAPEEPRITKEQVVGAFQSFGFEPNERNQNDIGYWTTRPQSEGPKLMEELKKRRDEMNSKEDVDVESKKALPRLNDQEIKDLFDEYGFPAPDPEWARNTLPNDPQKIRSILDMQRKTTDDIAKKESLNKVNSIPEVPNNVQTPPMPAAPIGSPMGISPEGGMPMPGMEPMTPFFIGENALVRITNPNDPQTGTLWLADKNKKVLRPLLSEQALENAFENPEVAKQSIVTLSSQALGPGGPLEGFTLLDKGKGIKEDGTMGKIDFSPHQLQKKYGKEEDPRAENKALSMIDGLMGKFK